MPEYSLKSKVVIVTGASSGIGRGCAEAFATEGAFVAITGRNEAALNEVAKKCIELGLPQDKVLAIVADHSKEEDNVRTVAETIAKFGQLDVVINNAGILVTGSTEALSLEDYDRQMNINTRAVFHMCKLAIPHLRKTKGNIVNVSSVTGLRSFPGVVSYNMSKAAVDHLTRCCCLEVAPDGVRVNAVNPGVIVTDVHRRSGMDDQRYQEFLEHCKSTHALGRAGQVPEVAAAVLFLASPLASFITGATLPVDGGRHAMCPR